MDSGSREERKVKKDDIITEKKGHLGNLLTVFVQLILQ